VNHIEMLHDVTERTMVAQMEHYVGPDWEQRYDELAAVREQERKIIEAEPHGTMIDDKGENWDVWCGTRRTDEQQTAAGFYRHYPIPTEDDPDALRLEFRPLVSGLSHEQAAFFAQALSREMNGDMDKLKELAGLLNGMNAEQRTALIAEIEGYEWAARDVSPDFEL
jgi:FtsP/CotA-like multicopper oxidase with cupredoxin domain